MFDTKPAPLTLELLGPGRFRVSGGKSPHIVDLTGATAVCDCPDHRYRHRRCKHLAAVDRYLDARQRASDPELLA